MGKMLRISTKYFIAREDIHLQKKLSHSSVVFDQNMENCLVKEKFLSAKFA